MIYGTEVQGVQKQDDSKLNYRMSQKTCVTFKESSQGFPRIIKILILGKGFPKNHNSDEEFYNNIKISSRVSAKSWEN